MKEPIYKSCSVPLQGQLQEPEKTTPTPDKSLIMSGFHENE